MLALLAVGALAPAALFPTALLPLASLLVLLIISLPTLFDYSFSNETERTQFASGTATLFLYFSLVFWAGFATFHFIETPYAMAWTSLLTGLALFQYRINYSMESWSELVLVAHLGIFAIIGILLIINLLTHGWLIAIIPTLPDTTHWILFVVLTNTILFCLYLLQNSDYTPPMIVEVCAHVLGASLIFFLYPAFDIALAPPIILAGLLHGISAIAWRDAWFGTMIFNRCYPTLTQAVADRLSAKATLTLSEDKDKPRNASYSATLIPPEGWMKISTLSLSQEPVQPGDWRKRADLEKDLERQTIGIAQDRLVSTHETPKSAHDILHLNTVISSGP